MDSKKKNKVVLNTLQFFVELYQFNTVPRSL